MDIIMLSVNAVIPLFIVMALGCYIGRKKLIDGKISKNLSIIAFNILMPFHLFKQIYDGAGDINISKSLLFWIIIIEAASFVVAYVLSKFISKDKAKAGSMLQAIFRANMIVFGLPIAQSMLSKGDVALFTIALLVILPLQTFGTVLGVEMYSGSEKKNNWGMVIFKAFVNPNTLGMIIGVIFVMLNIKLPDCITKGIGDIAKMASPLCLLLIGADFKFEGIKEHFKDISLATICRLFIMPLIFIPVIMFADLTYAEKFIILILSCAPTATSIYTAVEQGGLDKYLAKEMIVFTTLCSLISLTVWVYVLQIIA